MPAPVLTGDAWLDGVLWGRAIPLTGDRARIHVREFPDGLFRRLADHLQRAGCTFSVISDRETGDPVYWQIESHVSGRRPFRGLPRAVGDRRIERDFADSFIQGFLMGRLMFAQSGLRFSWQQGDIPELLSERGLEIRGANGSWRLLSASRTHPLIADFSGWVEAMLQRADAEEGPLRVVDLEEEVQSQTVIVTPFLSRVYWHLVRQPSTGANLWERFRHADDCPYSHHTQFLGDVARIAPDEHHPLPVVRSRIRSRTGAIMMMVPPIYHVSEAVTDTDLEIEAMFQVPTGFEEEIVAAHAQALEESGITDAGQLVWIHRAYGLGTASDEALAKLDGLLRRRDRERRVWSVHYRQALTEFAAAFLAALSEGIVNNYVVLSEDLLGSPGFRDFLCWLSDEGATIEVPNWSHHRMAQGIYIRRARGIRVLPPHDILEHAAMMAQGQLHPSRTCAAALGRAMGIAPETSDRVQQWLGAPVPEALRAETLHEIIGRVWPSHDSRRTASRPAGASRRPETTQALLPVDWSSVDFSNP